MARRAHRLVQRAGWTRRFLAVVPMILPVTLPVILAVGGCSRAVPECDAPEARQTMADLFRRQLKLTPYVRFIDMQRAALTVNAIFPVKGAQQPGVAGQASVSCVAFVRYDAPLNEAGRAVEVENKLMFNLIYELANEKQIYYRVEIEKDGRPRVHVDRVGG